MGEASEADTPHGVSHRRSKEAESRRGSAATPRAHRADGPRRPRVGNPPRNFPAL